VDVFHISILIEVYIPYILRTRIESLKKLIQFLFISVARPKPVCSYHQLMTCFPNKVDLFLEFNGKAFNETVNCYCLQNCIDSIVVIEKKQRLVGTQLYLSQQVGILMSLKSFAPYRYQRQVIYTLTDFFGMK
jgi:hypothetical protein